VLILEVKRFDCTQ